MLFQRNEDIDSKVVNYNYYNIEMKNFSQQKEERAPQTQERRATQDFYNGPLEEVDSFLMQELTRFQNVVGSAENNGMTEL